MTTRATLKIPTRPTKVANDSHRRRPAIVTPPVAAPSPEAPADLPRLAKVMSERGLCSRREADNWIEQGWVSVNGQVVTALGTRVAPDARITVDPAAAKHLRERVTILLHKAAGMEGLTEKNGRVISRGVVDALNHWDQDLGSTSFQRGHLSQLVYAGSLDAKASGLVVFTQDGRVARRLIAGDVEEEFIVLVEGEMSQSAAKRLEHGLTTRGRKLGPVKVSSQSEGAIRLVLRGSHPGLIDDICESLGLRPREIRRIRMGSVPLAKLPAGQWRYLRRGERL